MINSPFTYAIIGGGLAGLQLANALLENQLLENYSLLIVEPSLKDQNDKTWSFWEKGKGKWDSLICDHWETALFTGKKAPRSLSLTPYSYKCIQSIDFYKAIIPKLIAHQNVVWKKAKPLQIKKNQQYEIRLDNEESYLAEMVFDSRTNETYQNSKYPYVLQHFKGWIIDSPKAYFNPDSFSIMDFSINYQNQCCFTYVLPFSENKALVEFTFFSRELVHENVYDEMIQAYLKKNKILEYTIQETEKGVIPMSAYPFEKENCKNYLKIGTAGGWVKASSGYSFKNTEKKVAQIIQNLKQKRALNHRLVSKRHKWYDDIMLRLLAYENEIGNQIFIEMFNKNDIQSVFAFLDEESSFWEELKLINRFSKRPFLRALQNKYFS